jgi:hypothetical protein
MLARQPETNDTSEVPANHLKLVEDRLPQPEVRQGRRRLPFISNALERLREEIRSQPERVAWLTDRLIILGITVVIAVSAYILLVADPG